MANPYEYDGPDTRWATGEATTVPRLNVSRNNADYLFEAVSVLTDPDEAEGLKGSWQNPIIFRASASCYGSMWLDNTDTGNILWRTKTGTSIAAVTPANITDGVMVTVGAFS
ncbi:MAG: hypothetical protein FJY95_22380 [Candidatus Handelsmanbacteria bacterium]|nr:hypothetical protein [Candidatus Handelsmanbacteria bacterium]